MSSRKAMLSASTAVALYAAMATNTTSARQLLGADHVKEHDSMRRQALKGLVPNVLAAAPREPGPYWLQYGKKRRGSHNR
jgi:hypothetical protein